MRVAVVSFENPITFTGGVEHHAVKLARALGELGHEVRLVTRAPDDRPPPEDPWGIETTWIDLPVPRGPLSTYHHQRLMRPFFHARLDDAVAGVDLVHSQDEAGLGAHGTAPVVVTVHTDVVGEFEAARKPLPWGIPQRVAVRWDVARWRRYADRARASIAVSEVTAESMREHLGFDPTVIPNGLVPREPVKREVAREATGTPFEMNLLYFGRLAEVKRVDRLVDALARLPEEVGLTVGGDGPQREALEEQVLEQGLEERVRFLGYVPEEDKHAVIASADALALPSEHEGQPIVLLEALQQGVPVVVSRLGWLPEELQAHAHGAPPEAGVEQLVDAVGSAMEAGRLTGVEVPSWTDVAEATVEVYEAALEER